MTGSSKAICCSTGTSCSLWMDVQLPSFDALQTDINTDICIIGGGIAGLTSAYLLANEGKSITVIDKGPLAGGETARTTAHLTWALDERYYSLENTFGTKGARLALESHLAAIDQIEKIIQHEQIDCDFQRIDGYLFPSPKTQDDILDKERNAIKKIGREIHKIHNLQISPTFTLESCLRFPNQAQFHVLKYLQGLINAILKKGGKIFCNTLVKQVIDGSPCVIKTASGKKIFAQSAIVATCTPFNDRIYIHTKQIPYRTYVIALPIPKNSVVPGLYWDTEEPYHYIRLQKHPTDTNLEYLIVGGEDHITGRKQDPKKGYHDLYNWTKERFPMINKIEYQWSGQIYEPTSYLAFIGKNPGDKNIYIATGTSGNGMTYGTLSGILISDLILGKENPWASLYKPSRKNLYTIGNYLKEATSTILQYRDWLTPGERKKISELPTEEGIILRKGLKKIAVYKDSKNKIYACSAFCPHLGGCVRWNSSEKSWDCPCHGSRFNTKGKVMNGPAFSNLVVATLVGQKDLKDTKDHKDTNKGP